MALSNIFREPRREITESAFGIGVAISVISIDYGLARVIQGMPFFNHPNGGPMELPLAMVVVVLILFITGVITTGFLVATHSIGEGICGILERHGLDPRPKQRY